jgi:iron complex transport system permease protein
VALAVGLWGWHGEAPGWSEIVRLGLQPDAVAETDRYILLHMRLPRLVLAALAGMALSIAGLGLQGLFRNPLVDPFVIGVSGGGALGAGFALLLGLPALSGIGAVPLCAFGAALATMALVYALGQQRGQVQIERLLLAGVAVSALSSSLLSLFLVLRGEGMDTVVYWIMGSFAGRTWGDVGLLGVCCIPGWLLLQRDIQGLNALQVGEESALYLGVPVVALKRRVILAATLLAAAVVSVSGVIGFIGLVVPHMARFLMRTSDFRRLLFPSMLLGAALLMAADAVARNTLPAQEIPVGIFTAILGVPFFLGLLVRKP